MGQRHTAREAALGYLYQMDLGLESATLSTDLYLKHFYPDSSISDLFLRLTLGVKNDQTALDEKIQACSEHWKVARMERVDRVILRLATWELIEEKETPARVIIDEAVELAKKFSTTESASFVNGVLDQISKRYRTDSSTELSMAEGKKL